MFEEVIFSDRYEAGKELAVRLKRYANQSAVVLALPRGGVVLGREIADNLKLPLGIILVSKIGHPFNSEYAIGAMSLNGQLVKNEFEFKSIEKNWLKDEMAKQKDKLLNREKLYLASQKPVSLKNKIAIIVDDGVATGLTLLAAIKDAKKQNPRKIVVAVPVCPSDTAEKIRTEIDELVVLDIPQLFMGSVGSYYQDFPQVSDEEVIALLKKENFADNDPAYLFSFPEFSDLGKKISRSLQIATGKYQIKRFADRELQIKIKTDIKNNTALILGNIWPSETQLVEILLLAHTLKKEGARKIIVICPYLAYARQDKLEPHASLAADFIAKLLESVKVDKVITIDIHSVLAKKYFKGKLISLSGSKIFASELKKIVDNDFSLVSPDEGALGRSQELARLLKIKKPLAFFQKKRSDDSLKLKLQGRPSEKVIIADDILSTGKTLVEACEILQKRGVKEIIICVTHGLFIDSSWKKLWSLGVRKIYTTDSFPENKKIKNKKIISISCHDLLVENIKKYIDIKL